MPTADKGVQAGYSNPSAREGDGVEPGPTPTFVGAQAGQVAPTLNGYVKKRPVLGDVTVLDSLQQQ
jgi:hypothetical protein